MKKGIALLLTVVCVIGLTGCQWMFEAQYNEHGVSHFLVITVDEAQPREYMGELDSYRVYLEGMDPEETYFTTVNAENMFIREALEKGLVSVDEWREYAWDTETDGEAEILRYENYEILLANGECVIRPFVR